MKLVIVESPNKCGKIRSFLGDGYKVMASVGHIREIPKQSINVDIKGGFEPTYEVIKDKKSVVKDIQEAAKSADEIYLATDPDREGEGIAKHVYDILDKSSQKKCKRITFVEITKKAITDAIQKPRDIDASLVDAQKARQVLDRLIGYKCSPLLWYSAKLSGSSAGRVQSIALKLIVDRQKEINAFKPEDYWFIEALLKCKNGEFAAKVVTKEKDNRYVDEKLATSDLEKLQKASFVLDKVERAEKKNNPPPPFDTNSLQVTCSSTFGWSLSKSQSIAQKLYENAKVTYIRSDSFNISQEALDEVRKYIKENHSNAYFPDKPNIYTKKSSASAQEAHECIRPTHIGDEGSDIDDSDEKKMYDLIRDRFLACQMTPQIVDTVVYNTKASSGHSLISKGQTIKFDGWTKAYKYSKTKEEILPNASEKENLDLKDIKKTKHTTQPPARYNEGSLAKEMEKNGVGRPATRATIITAIQKKGYADKDKKSKGLVATDLGIKICDYLQPNFKDFFMDIKYTSTLEDDLDEIAQGNKKYLEVMTSVYDILQSHIKKAEGDKPPKVEPTKTGSKCLRCKEGEIVERKGRFGEFFACNKYPTCKTVFEKTEDGKFKIKERKKYGSTGKKCPECEKNGRNGELIERSNKKTGNKFIACSCWPACKYNMSLDSDNSVKKEEKQDDSTEELDLSIGGEEEN